MSVEDAVRDALRRQAEAVDVVRPAWDDVLDRRPVCRRGAGWRRPVLALAALLALLGGAAVLTQRRDARVSVVSPPPPPEPAEVRTFNAVEHRVIGEVVNLEAHDGWSVVAYPSNLGPCVGVAPDGAKRNWAHAPGFPDASAECSTDLAARGITAFRVRGPSGLVLVGLTADVRRPVVVRVNQGKEQRPALHPLPFDPSTAAFAVGLADGDDMASITLRHAGERGVGQSALYGSLAGGPGVVVATSDGVDLVAHVDDELLCLHEQRRWMPPPTRPSTGGRTSVSAALGGTCGRDDVFGIGGSFQRATQVFGSAGASATAVRLLDAHGNEVARLPTFAIPGNPAVRFYLYDGPPFEYGSVEPLAG